MIKVGLAGGRGYVGQELLGLLAGSPDYEVVYVGSRSSAGKTVTSEYPDSRCDLTFADLSSESIQSCAADAWVIAQPNGKADQFVQLFDESIRIIDISSDFRFDETWTYGLPELNQAAIQTNSRVANPGCYATATQLALLPLINQVTGVPTAFGISGYSGAGRTPSDKNNPDRLANNILPYSLTDHTHEREVSRHLQRAVRFMPHVASFFRGITITVNVKMADEIEETELLPLFEDYYKSFPLVQVTDSIPEIQQVAGTNRAVVGGFAVDPRDRRRVAIVSVIDNLRKGAASQAVQNMNLMFGFPSEKGLVE